MSRPTVGSRVVAVCDADTETVRIFGCGVYVGDEVPEGAGGFMADLLRSIGRTNPKIVLDGGAVVWGCECWWGPEEGFAANFVKGRIIEEVSIVEARARATRKDPA